MTNETSSSPSEAPTFYPSDAPTFYPTEHPTYLSTSTASSSSSSSLFDSLHPSSYPSSMPSSQTSPYPSSNPTSMPSEALSFFDRAYYTYITKMYEPSYILLILFIWMLVTILVLFGYRLLVSNRCNCRLSAKKDATNTEEYEQVCKNEDIDQTKNLSRGGSSHAPYHLDPLENYLEPCLEEGESDTTRLVRKLAGDDQLISKSVALAKIEAMYNDPFGTGSRHSSSDHLKRSDPQSFQFDIIYDKEIHEDEEEAGGDEEREERRGGAIDECFNPLASPHRRAFMSQSPNVPSGSNGDKRLGMHHSIEFLHESL